MTTHGFGPRGLRKGAAPEPRTQREILLEGALRNAILQLEYVDTRFPTGSTAGVIAQCKHLLG